MQLDEIKNIEELKFRDRLKAFFIIPKYEALIFEGVEVKYKMYKQIKYIIKIKFIEL